MQKTYWYAELGLHQINSLYAPGGIAYLCILYQVCGASNGAADYVDALFTAIPC